MDSFLALSQLELLTKLRLDYAQIDLTTFDETKMKPFLRMRWLVLNKVSLFGPHPINFCHMFSIMFPNLEVLALNVDDTYDMATYFEPHLGMFVNLEKTIFDRFYSVYFV